MRLTRRQLQVLVFINNRVAMGSPAPTFREIGKHLGFSSTNASADHLKALEKKGVIERGYGKSRHIRITALGREYLNLPGITEVPSVESVVQVELSTEDVELLRQSVKIGLWGCTLSEAASRLLSERLEQLRAKPLE
jgi:SOS-response transcriptional repressor LexA